MLAALLLAQQGPRGPVPGDNANPEVGFVSRLRAALRCTTLSSHITQGVYDHLGYSAELPFRKAERLAERSLTADHIPFHAYSNRLTGVVHYKSGPRKEILFYLGPMKIDQHSLGIEGTEKTWSCLVITTVYRHRDGSEP
jgi:hypothetical protein